MLAYAFSSCNQARGGAYNSTGDNSQLSLFHSHYVAGEGIVGTHPYISFFAESILPLSTATICCIAGIKVFQLDPISSTKKYITPLTYCITWEVFTVSKPLSSIHQSSPD
jgi:hypothetical protein